MEMSWQPDKQASGFRRKYRKLSPADIKKYIDDNWTKKIALDDLADRFFINKCHLTRLYKRQYGKTIINYLIDLRITHAKEMLRFTDYSIESIAVECGFEDANYFSRIFKKIEGVAPSTYRRNWSRS